MGNNEDFIAILTSANVSRHVLWSAMLVATSFALRALLLRFVGRLAGVALAPAEEHANQSAQRSLAKAPLSSAPTCSPSAGASFTCSPHRCRQLNRRPLTSSGH